MLFNERIKNARINLGMSIQEVADKVGISRPYLSQIESGKKGVPTYSIVTSLIEVLGIERKELLSLSGYENYVPETIDFKNYIVSNELLYNDKTITNEQKQKILTMLDVILN